VSVPQEVTHSLVDVSTARLVAMLRGRLRGSCKHFVNSKSSVAERTGSYAVKVRELLTKLNHRPFRKRDGSRATAFEAIDKPALKPLPIFATQPRRVGHARAATFHGESGDPVVKLPPSPGDTHDASRPSTACVSELGRLIVAGRLL
jgi:hypothetical protein